MFTEVKLVCTVASALGGFKFKLLQVYVFTERVFGQKSDRIRMHGNKGVGLKETRPDKSTLLRLLISRGSKDLEHCI